MPKRGQPQKIIRPQPSVLVSSAADGVCGRETPCQPRCTEPGSDGMTVSPACVAEEVGRQAQLSPQPAVVVTAMLSTYSYAGLVLTLGAATSCALPHVLCAPRSAAAALALLKSPTMIAVVLHCALCRWGTKAAPTAQPVSWIDMCAQR